MPQVKCLIATAAAALMFGAVTASADQIPQPEQLLPRGCTFVYPKGHAWPVNGVTVPMKRGDVALILCRGPVPPPA